MRADHEHPPNAKSWPDPDMSILQPKRPSAPKLTNESLSLIYGTWAEWLKTAATAKGGPVDYVAAALLATASALIGNTRWASPWLGWKEPTVLWIMLVGEPSAGKSPALDAVLEALRPIEKRLNEAYDQKRHSWRLAQEIADLCQSQWKGESKAALEQGLDPPPKPVKAEAPPQPIRERLTIADATTEQVAVLMSHIWRGLLMTRDELAGWLGNMDRYTSGSGDQAFWIEAYGGRPFIVDRKGSAEPLLIDHLSVAVLGGTQPDKLKRLLERTDNDGLMARFITVFPEPVPLSRPQQAIDTAKLQAAFERLYSLSAVQDETGKPRPVLLPFSLAAADLLDEFRVQCRIWENGVSGAFKGHIGKMPGLVVRLACVLAHLDWAAATDLPPPHEINHRHVNRARTLVTDYLRLHAVRAYSASQPDQDRHNASHLAKYLLRVQPNQITAREIQRKGPHGLQTAQQVAASAALLMEAGWLRKKVDLTGGRPSAGYEVNPKLWDNPSKANTD